MYYVHDNNRLKAVIAEHTNYIPKKQDSQPLRINRRTRKKKQSLRPPERRTSKR